MSATELPTMVRFDLEAINRPGIQAVGMGAGTLFDALTHCSNAEPADLVVWINFNPGDFAVKVDPAKCLEVFGLESSELACGPIEFTNGPGWFVADRAECEGYR